MVLVADPYYPVSQFRRKAWQCGENRGRYVIDVDETSIVELPWKIGSANPQFPCKGGIVFQDPSCFGPSLPTSQRFTDRRVHTVSAWYCPARGWPHRISLGPGGVSVTWFNKLSPNAERRCKTAANQHDDQYTTRGAVRIIRRADQDEGEDGYNQRDDGGNA
ncbi:hypothetical protein ABTZ58_38740 [Streptomyces sp. NPDC094143]|uniref:hypothetical protein n=1 Tax=Streptomyces sp. NPDC094143 TaxID=3155310 RepID=UPI003330426F